VKNLPTVKLDSAAHITSIKKDSLICTDEKTYRSLVISSLNFGEQKYTLCLGQIQQKDSAIVSFQKQIHKTLDDATTFENEKKEVDLHLASIKRSRYNWLLVGLAGGVGISIATLYLVR
jgi:hypothetical protein